MYILKKIYLQMIYCTNSEIPDLVMKMMNESHF